MHVEGEYSEEWALWLCGAGIGKPLFRGALTRAVASAGWVKPVVSDSGIRTEFILQCSDLCVLSPVPPPCVDLRAGALLPKHERSAQRRITRSKPLRGSACRILKRSDVPFLCSGTRSPQVCSKLWGVRRGFESAVGQRERRARAKTCAYVRASLPVRGAATFRCSCCAVSLAVSSKRVHWTPVPCSSTARV